MVLVSYNNHTAVIIGNCKQGPAKTCSIEELSHHWLCKLFSGINQAGAKQYFFESDLDGRPFNKCQRSIVYQRAKNGKQTVAFGLSADTNAPGFEWVAHSVYPISLSKEDLQVRTGNRFCKLPYEACYSARGMMFALGCIQALICDTGKCPVGVATQNPALYKGLDPADKGVRVFNFYRNTIQAVKEMMEVYGFKNIKSIQASKFFRRTGLQTTKSFEDIYFKKIKGHIQQQNFKSLLN